MFKNLQGWTVSAGHNSLSTASPPTPPGEQPQAHNDRRQTGPYLDHPGHAQPGIQCFPDRLYVIAVISNPRRFRKRYRLYEAFAQMVLSAGAVLLTVETAFGEREFEVTSAENPYHLQLRQFDELWNKESMINAGVQHLTKLAPGWKYLAWIDADVTFSRSDWAQETLHQLQHNKVVQMWSHCMDLTDQYEPLEDLNGGEYLPGFVYQWYKTFRYGSHEGFDIGYGSSPDQQVLENQMVSWLSEADTYYASAATPQQKNVVTARTVPGQKKLRPGHCGYAWAIRRDAYEELGGLLDISIAGANDHHMAAAFVGDILKSVNPACHPEFLADLKNWGARAHANVKPYVGYVPGLILHHYHGHKKGRRYIDRWKILTQNQYNSRTHIRRDAQGLWVWNHPHTPHSLIVDLRQYMTQRNEDASHEA